MCLQLMVSNYCGYRLWFPVDIYFSYCSHSATSEPWEVLQRDAF